jgi:hypothetical protein
MSVRGQSPVNGWHLAPWADPFPPPPLHRCESRTKRGIRPRMRSCPRGTVTSAHVRPRSVPGRRVQAITTTHGASCLLEDSIVSPANRPGGNTRALARREVAEQMWIRVPGVPYLLGVYRAGVGESRRGGLERAARPRHLTTVTRPGSLG